MTQTINYQDMRWQEIQRIWKENQWLYVIAGFLIGILSVPALEQITGDLNSLIGNLVPETIGIIFTVVILNRASDNRARNEKINQLLEELKSSSIAPAVNALDRLRRENWIPDDHFVNGDLQRANWEGAYIGDLNFDNANLRGANLKRITLVKNRSYSPVSFRGADLSEADLEGANLSRANLESVNLIGANLKGANLWAAHLEKSSLMQTNLQNATLISIYLEGANLSNANLENAQLTSAKLNNTNIFLANLRNANLPSSYLKNAYLCQANLEGAKLWSSNLQCTCLASAKLDKADLSNANLEGAELYRAQLKDVKWAKDDGTEATILPDGSRWTPDVDMERFTNSKHEDYLSTLNKINEVRKTYGREPITI